LSPFRIGTDGPGPLAGTGATTEDFETMAVATYGSSHESPRGRCDRTNRDADDRLPHLQNHILAGATPWRLAVAVRCQDGSEHVIRRRS
jgi:hypothetical protein